MKNETLKKIKEAINSKCKTLEIDDVHFVVNEKMYFSNSKKYAVINGGFNRWLIIDLLRNLESDACEDTKREALNLANRYEENQLQNGFENDKNKFNQNNPNNEFYQIFGTEAFNNRYYK